MIKKYVILLLAIFFLYTPLIADSVLGGKDSPSGMIDNIGKKFTAYASGKKNILKAIKLEKKGKIKKANKLYKKALFYLIKANKEKQLDPDILNYLGCHVFALKPRVTAIENSFSNGEITEPTALSLISLQIEQFSAF